jgi:hypothetical protein
MKRILLTLAALFAVFQAAQAQTDSTATVEVYEEDLYDLSEDEYALEYGLGENIGLGVYGGEYYLTGYSSKTGTSRETDFNDKFHIGLQYTLVNDQYVTLLVKYEQTSFWETYQYARPISETIFAPGGEISFKMNGNARLVLGAEMQFNGAADEYARRLTYGRIALYRDFPLRRGALFSAALQSGFGYGYIEEESTIRNYYRYNGYFTAGLWFQSADENFKMRLKATPYDYFDHCAVQFEIHYRPYYSLLDNVYYMVQYGYGLEQQHQFLPEGTPLKPQHYIRIGLSVCPEFTL